MTFDPSRELRPLDFASLLDQALDIFTKNLPLMLGITAAAYVPIIVMNVIGSVFFPITVDMSRLLPMKDVPFYWTLVRMVAVAAPIVTNGALVVAVAYLLLGRPVTVRSVFGIVRSRLVPLLITGFLTGVIVVLCFSFMYIFAYLLLIPLIFASEAVILEKRQGFDALQRSAFLAVLNGQGLRVLLMCASLALLYGVPWWLLSTVLGWVFSPTGSIGAYVFSGAHELMMLAITPFAHTALTLMYVDIRVRDESFTIDTLAYDLPD